MKKLLSLFPSKKVMGISERDWIAITNQISDEYYEARNRQKSADAEPTKYMQGLQKALDIIESVKPRNLMEV
jgi:hypothetical protein